MINKKYTLAVILGMAILAMSGCDNTVDINTSISEDEVSIKSDVYSNVQKKKENFNGLKKFINISMIVGGIDIKKSPDNDIHVEYPEQKKVKVDEQGSALIIHYDEKQNLINEGVLVTLYVPETFMGELTAELQNGDVNITDIKNLAKVEFNAENGDVECKNLKANSVKIVSDNGDIECIKLSADEMILSSEKGDIDCDNSKAKKMTLESEDGDIEFEKIDATKSMEIVSENGDIDGSLAKDIKEYNLSTDIVGDSNIPKSNEAKGADLYIACENGDVEIR